jgi:spore coat protein U-like protein
MRVAALALASGLGLAALPRTALALLQSCTVAASPSPFGLYVPSNPAALSSSSGTITVTCSVTLVGLLEGWTILLSTGNSGTFAARQMSVAGRSLSYNLYTTAAHTQVWGDGTAGTGTISDLQLLTVGTNSYPYTVYGSVPALQDQPPGTYNDVIVVTVNYN